MENVSNIDKAQEETFTVDIFPVVLNHFSSVDDAPKGKSVNTC